MVLLSLSEIAKPMLQEGAVYGNDTQQVSVFSDTAVNTIAAIEKLLNVNDTVFFISTGNFSLHEMVKKLIRITGPADVIISTWAISEVPIRSLSSMKFDGLIKNIDFIFDHKIRDRQTGPHQLCQGISRKMIYTSCHAKMTLIVGTEKTILVNGSMNWTRNPRIESGMVTYNEGIVRFFQTELNRILNA